MSTTVTGTLPADLTIVSPTFNEVDNIEHVVDAVAKALPGIRWELVFVDDDSPDGTSERIRELAQRDARVRIVHRYGRRGLSSACVEGIMASSSPYVAVMDSDLQHDETVLARMFARIQENDVDLVIGSRYVEGGGTGEWSNARVKASKVATALARKLTRIEISDPMSGFFMIRRDAFFRSLPRLSSVGFKILLDIAASAPQPLRTAEIPYEFRTRQHGASKLDSLVLWEYLELLLDKMFGRYVPARFISFVLVGGFGVFVHFAILSLMFKGVGLTFAAAQTVAALVAISNNFFLNNALTYRDQRLKGRSLVVGWISFNLVCATGAVANIGASDWLFENDTNWALSAIIGVLISAVWNYAMSALFTWRKR